MHNGSGRAHIHTGLIDTRLDEPPENKQNLCCSCSCIYVSRSSGGRGIYLYITYIFVVRATPLAIHSLGR